MEETEIYQISQDLSLTLLNYKKVKNSTYIGTKIGFKLAKKTEGPTGSGI